MKKLLLISILALNSQAFALREYYSISRSIRALGMGGAFYGLFNDAGDAAVFVYVDGSALVGIFDIPRSEDSGRAREGIAHARVMLWLGEDVAEGEQEGFVPYPVFG